MSKVMHYAGALTWRKGRTVTKVGGGFAACCTGDRAYRIRAEGRHTLDVSAVTCCPCLARIEWDAKTEREWNWCKHCAQLVDADDVSDGTEVRCLGCRRVYVCVAYEDGTWGLGQDAPLRRVGGAGQ